jgi:hypothetical protein
MRSNVRLREVLVVSVIALGGALLVLTVLWMALPALASPLAEIVFGLVLTIGALVGLFFLLRSDLRRKREREMEGHSEYVGREHPDPRQDQ